MGRSRYGNAVNGYNGLTETLAANILRTRKAGTVVKSGRLVSLGAYLGADAIAVANARLAAHLINPGTLDPATLLAESDRIGVNTLWNANGAGGAVFELPVAIPWHLEELGSWNLWLQSYYQGTATGTIADATALSSWPPVGGIGPTPVQATGANKPILKLAQQNGLDVVRFDGSNDYLSALTATLPPMAQPYSFAVVWKPANIAFDQIAIQFDSAFSPALYRRSIGNQSMYAGVALDQPMPGGQWSISVGVFNGVNSINMLNGVAVIGDVGSLPIASGILYIGIGPSITNPLNGDIGEIFIDNRAWSMTECQFITQRLAWVWGLTSVLPTGFPYKTNPYLINGGKLVNAGDDIAVGVHSDGTLRMPANFFLGGHKWEQVTSGLNAPSPMVPTTDTDDDKGLSTYFVVEENRPPVLTPVNPIDNKIVTMGLPDYAFTAADPDRSEGYGDYIKQAVVRIWERFRGVMYYAGQRSKVFTRPSSNDRDSQSLTVSQTFFNPITDFTARMSTRLAAWNNPAQTDNTDLTTWIDGSDSGNNATQTTVANKPKYRTVSGPGSLPAIDFDGTNDFMFLTGVPAGGTLDEAIFALIKPDVLGRWFIGVQSGGLSRSVYVTAGGAVSVYKNGVGDIATTPAGLVTVGQWAIIGVIIKPNEIRISVNGAVYNFYHNTVFAAGTTIIGAADNGPNSPFDGMIEDVIILKASELRPGDQERFVGYLAWGYGLSANLLATHFYKTYLPGLRVSPPPPNTNNTARWEGINTSNVDGLAMPQWSDTGPSGAFPLIQATGVSQPIWRSPRINGLGAADFDGTNDYFSLTTVSASVLDEACFALVKLRSFSTAPAILGTTVANGRIFYIDNTGALAIWSTTGNLAVASPGGATPLNEWAILHWIVRATSWELGRNGVVVRGSHASSFAAAATTIVGGWNGSQSNALNGLIAKLVRMPASELGVDGAERWVGKIAAEYDLQSLLPDTHPYRFESPGDDIEHAWTVEAQDEIGGDSGTGTAGYDGDIPDESMTFYASATGYSFDATGITIPNIVADLNGDNKTSRRTLASFTSLYSHPLGIAAAGIRVRIAKKDANGVYQEDQVSPWFYTAIASGATFNYQWWRTLFEPLAFGFDYAAEVQYIDKNGIVSQWRGREEFHTNYPPNQGAITTPANPTAATSPPLTLFSVIDDDDAGTAYYDKPEWAIWELEAGATGAGTSPPQFNAPYQVATDLSGNVYIADNANGRIMKLDANLGFLLQITDPAVGVRGVAIDSSGNIYVADSAAFVIKKYNSAGALLATSPTIPTTPGFGPRVPYHLSLSALGVTFSVPNSSHGFSSVPQSTLNPGAIWSSIDGKGDNRNVSVIGVAWPNVLLGEFWAAEYAEADMKLYTGTWVLKDKWGDYDRIKKPVAIAVQADTGNIWITDEIRKTVMEYSRYGDFLGEVGPIFNVSGGTASMTWPYGLAFSPAGDKFYVVDSAQNKVRRFRVSEQAEKTNTGCAGEVAIKGPMAVLNQSFEDGSASWATNNSAGFTATAGLASTSPAEGNNYYHIAFTAGPTKPSNTDPTLAGYSIQNNSHFPVVPGFSYQVSAKFRRDKVGMFGQVGINWLHDIGALANMGTSWSNPVRPTIDTWTEAQVSEIAPAGATGASVVLFSGIDVGGLVYPVTIDWDDVQIEDGVRFVRGASFIGDDDYSYQLTGTDMPLKGVYSLMARGRDGDNPGPWSDVSTIYYVDGPTATIVSPTPGQVFTTATPIFLWQITAGAQWAYKVEVLDTNGIIIYTSDWIQSGNARSHQVPASAGLADGGSYIGRLWIDDGNLQVLVG